MQIIYTPTTNIKHKHTHTRAQMHKAGTTPKPQTLEHVPRFLPLSWSSFSLTDGKLAFSSQRAYG